jgi:hypothetical protein
LCAPERTLPDHFPERQRVEFLEISNRAKNEVCASFSLVSIGLMQYMEQRAQERDSAARALVVPGPCPCPAPG